MGEIGIVTADGTALQGCEYRPPSAVRGCVVVAPALGVEQRFYAGFAEWLSSRGFLVITFDFRGVGRSRQGSLRGFQADLTTWVMQDCAAMVSAAVERADGCPVFWVGHSLGGQIFGWIPNRHQVRALLTVASGTGYWRTNLRRLRLPALLGFCLVPAVLQVFGYFPGRLLRLVGDLPAGVMAQWRRWCLTPDYVVGAEAVYLQYARVQQPIFGFLLADDEMVSRANVERMHALYSGVSTQLRCIRPSDIGAKRIGHFGFFRRQFAATLWPEAERWLAQQVAAPG